VASIGPTSYAPLDVIPWLRHAVTARDEARPLAGDMSFATGAREPDAVIANREAALAGIGRTADSGVISGLVHGIHVHAVDERDAGTGVRSSSTITHTDGLITATPGVTLMMCFADCVPLIVVDARRRIIGLAHAGWRGTLAGMSGSLITGMRHAFGCAPTDMHAVIGPSIGPAAYTVGDDVATLFVDAYPDDSLLRRDTAGTRLDLWEANRTQLLRTGLPPEQIHVSGICTFTNGDRIFSHRYALAHGEQEGRFAVLISIEG
jgi:YfiH family protein